MRALRKPAARRVGMVGPGWALLVRHAGVGRASAAVPWHEIGTTCQNFLLLLTFYQTRKRWACVHPALSPHDEPCFYLMALAAEAPLTKTRSPLLRQAENVML